MNYIPDNRLVIDDYKYFNMIDNQIRDAMPKFESSFCLDWALKVLEQSSIKQEELAEYPVEGYYYKNNMLKLYFQIIRNLQENEDIYDRVAKCEELTYLEIFTDNNIFGTKSTEEYKKPYINKKEPILKRRYDIMALALKEIGDTSNQMHPWTIDNILEEMGNHFTGNENLVELAYLTNDPRCVCCACETNILYREIIACSGYFNFQPIYRWDVSKEVEKMGKRLISIYNDFIKSNMVAPTIYNCGNLKKEPELPRVSTLGFVNLTEENYYWILDNQERLSDIYSNKSITTENYGKFQKEFLQ